MTLPERWASRLDRTALRLRVSSPRGRRLGAPAPVAGPLLLTALALLVHMLPGASELLEYDRGAILKGEIWRTITGHWTHHSLDHLVWDVLAFVALGVALAWRSRRLFRRAVLGSGAAISAVLLLLAPQWQSYRGLSGIDSALLVALAADLWIRRERRPDRWLAVAAVALLAGKVGFETMFGAALFTTQLPGQEVVPLAHFVGAAAGLTTAALEARRRVG